MYATNVIGVPVGLYVPLVQGKHENWTIVINAKLFWTYCVPCSNNDYMMQNEHTLTQWTAFVRMPTKKLRPTCKRFYIVRTIHESSISLYVQHPTNILYTLAHSVYTLL
jgi:hypothetical protein